MSGNVPDWPHGAEHIRKCPDCGLRYSHFMPDRPCPECSKPKPVAPVVPATPISAPSATKA